jgi:hypothetical protein
MRAPKKSASTSGFADIVTFSNIKVYDKGRCTTADGVVVACDQPHGNEEYASFTISPLLTPGDQQQAAIVQSECERLFEQYTGLVYANVRDQFGVLLASGNDIRCYLAGPRGGGIDVRTESARRR